MTPTEWKTVLRQMAKLCPNAVDSCTPELCDAWYRVVVCEMDVDDMRRAIRGVCQDPQLRFAKSEQFLSLWLSHARVFQGQRIRRREAVDWQRENQRAKEAQLRWRLGEVNWDELPKYEPKGDR